MVRIFNDVMVENKEVYTDDESLIICVGRSLNTMGYIKFLDLGVLTIWIRNSLQHTITIKKITSYNVVLSIGRYTYRIEMNIGTYAVDIKRTINIENELFIMAGFITGLIIGIWASS